MVLADLIGDSPGIVRLRHQAARLVGRPGDAGRLPPVLLQGETGTGKGLVARGLHRASARRAGPFVDVNCAAIPESLLEAEMFGVERGAFTGADRARPGLFQAAHRGTLFLDEIGLIPERLQGKLLKALEDRAVRRLGRTVSEPVDVWVVAATSEDLAEAMQSGRFRRELYHRLAVVTLRLPALRERGPDVELLAERFLERVCGDYGLAPKTLSQEARAALREYRWPGNVRELANVIERAVLLAEGSVVTAAALELGGPPGAAGEGSVAEGECVEPAPEGGTLRERLENTERQQLLEALGQTGWNLSHAAARLGLPRNTLRYRMERHGLRPPPPSRRPRPAPVPVVPDVDVAAATGSPVAARERRSLTLLRVALLTTPAPADWDTAHALDIVEKLESFGGQVEDVTPTAVVAAFGLEPVEDAPRRAALAAIAVQKVAERARRDQLGAWRVRAAIHVADCGLAPSGTRVELDGESRQATWPVLEALVEAAAPDVVVVSEPAAAFLRRRFDLQATAAVLAPGGRVYRLTGPEQSGFGVGERATGFVGRQEELALLESRLGTVRTGHGQVVAIIGDAGIGKSRLLFEFRQRLSAGDVTYLEGRCLSYGGAVPYQPVLDLLKQGCGITESDSVEAIADKLRAALSKLAVSAQDHEPYLLHLLGTKEVAERLRNVNPELLKVRTLDAVRSVAMAASRRRPLVLAVEDLHWIDKTSDEVLASLVEDLHGAPILLLVTYRPGYEPAWLARGHVTQVALPPMSAEDSGAILRSALGTERIAPQVAQRVLARAEGNPLFLEELARAVGEHADAAESVPDTVQGVLMARIDRLAAEDRRMLQVASVIGKDLPLALLQAMADEPEEVVRQRLRRLQTGEFLYETWLLPDRQYTFKHALTHEVAYASLLPETRRQLHARLVETLERPQADRLGEYVERLAHHAVAGELWDKAVRYLRQAAARAFARSDNRESVALLEQALTALGNLPETREKLEAAIDVRFELRRSLFPLVELERIHECLREAETLAARLQDRRRLGWVFVLMSHYLWIRGRVTEAAGAATEAVALAVQHDDVRLRVASTYYGGLLALAHGEYGSADAFLQNVLRLVDDELQRDLCGLHAFPAVLGRAALAWVQSECGNFTDAERYGQEAVALADALDHAYSRILAYSALAYACRVRGNLREATNLLERAVDLAVQYNLSALRLVAGGYLGHLYAVSGRAAEGIALLQQAVGALEALGIGAYHTSLVVHLGESLARLDQLDEAQAAAQHALALARERAERCDEAYALRLLGDIASRRVPPDPVTAERHYAASMALATELGMKPLIAHGHLGLGRLDRGEAQQGAANRHLTIGQSMLLDMDMRVWSVETAA